MEGIGVSPLAASVPRDPSAYVAFHIRTFAALSAAGFRRYATYRQATVAGAFTNIVF
jgi:ABC-2 type transport system permease protein